MTSAPPDTPTPRRTAPERRRRGDVVAAVALVVLFGVAALVVWRTSPEVATVSTPDARRCGPQPARRRARGLRRGVARCERRHAAHRRGGSRRGHRRRRHRRRAGRRNRRRGVELPPRSRAVHGRRGFPRHRRRRRPRPRPLRGRTGWCSELTALHPSSGKRADASNPDMQPGVQLLADGSYVTATGAELPGGVALRPRAHPRVRRRAHPGPARQAAASGLHVRLHGGQQRPHRRHRALPRRSRRPAHRAHPGRLQGRRHPRGAVLRRTARRRRCAAWRSRATGPR